MVLRDASLFFFFRYLLFVPYSFAHVFYPGYLSEYIASFAKVSARRHGDSVQPSFPFLFVKVERT